MAAQTQTEMHTTLREYMGRQLCDPCWNGAHYTRKTTRTGKKTSQKISNCLQGGCECLCRARLEEENRQRKDAANYARRLR